jgi:hypothetical protein
VPGPAGADSTVPGPAGGGALINDEAKNAIEVWSSSKVAAAIAQAVGFALGGPFFAYAANGITPQLVADFKGAVYGKNSGLSTFDGVLNHTRRGNAVMMDSDGLLKWAPHNIAVNLSELTANGGTLTLLPLEKNPVGGTGDVYRLQLPAEGGTYLRLGSGSDEQHTVAAFVKKNAVEPRFSFANGGASSADITSTDTWTLFSQSGRGNGVNGLSNGTDAYAADILIWRPRFYRSDLGGMANNPETGDSYVPTTDAARYLPRIGHHFYKDGVLTKGALFEPDAATNFITYSDPDAALPTDWTSPLNSGSRSLVTMANGLTGIEFVASNQRPMIQQSHSVTSGDLLTFSFFCENTSGMAGGEEIGRVSGPALSSPIAILVSDIGPDGLAFVSFTADTTAQLECRMGLGATSNQTGTIRCSSPQLEAGSVPSSYTPATGSEVTRAAEEVESDNLSYNSDAMWFSLKGYVTYADIGSAGQMKLFDWRDDDNNRITVTLDTDGAETGEITLTVVSGGTSWSVAADYLSPGINVPFNIAWRVTDDDINLAVGGTAATANTSPTSIPDLSSATAVFAVNGVQELFRQGVGNLGDTGIAEASE